MNQPDLDQEALAHFQSERDLSDPLQVALSIGECCIISMGGYRYKAGNAQNIIALHDQILLNREQERIVYYMRRLATNLRAKLDDEADEVALVIEQMITDLFPNSPQIGGENA